MSTNERRLRLIDKKYGAGLNDAEAAELARLRHEVHDCLRALFPRPADDPDAIDARLGRLKRRIEALRRAREGLLIALGAGKT